MELTERTHSHLGIGKRKKTEQTKGREGYEKTEFGQDAAISVEKEVIYRFLCNHISHVPVTLTLNTPWMRAHLETILCKFGRNPAICPQEVAIFVPAQKCPIT